MQVYWASMFILPVSIANDIERLMRDFLWNFGSSWSWKKILKVRGRIKDHIIHRIGDGRNTSLWFDNWHAICPLSDFISKRKIHNTGLTLNAKVSEVIVNGSWIWPDCLTSEFDGLFAIDPPIITCDKLDKVLWKTNYGMHMDFSVSTVYDDLRRGNLVVPWANLVRIWDKLKILVRLIGAPSKWSDIQDYMLRRPLNKSEDVILNLIKDTGERRLCLVMAGRKGHEVVKRSDSVMWFKHGIDGLSDLELSDDSGVYLEFSMDGIHFCKNQLLFHYVVIY
ncbi:hypothetical protein Tco_1511404 [Tanacetum coccineum]